MWKFHTVTIGSGGHLRPSPQKQVCGLTIRSSRVRFAASALALRLSQRRGRSTARLNSGVRPHDGSSQLPKEVSPNGKFDLLRFTIVMAVASIAFGLGKNAAESSRVLFAIGMFFLAIFAGFFNPLSKTPRSFKPTSRWQWIAFYSGIVGSVLLAFSILQRIC